MERETRYEPIALPVAVVPTSYIYPVVEVVNPVVYGYRPVVYRSYHRYYPAARVVHVHGRHEHYRRVHFYH
ncbi:MAG: hypothetical protein HYT46_00585 [Candidatus Vogelbacteria bacterium]|nr:hypothetical protein [Candidatus Vogelbacteria bacterium]